MLDLANLDPTQEFYVFLLMFVFFWCGILHMKEGARAEASTLRLNYWHGMISSYLVIHAFWKPQAYPEKVVIACSLSYFVVDLENMIMNDFVYKVGGYQKKTARVAEYFHHILSILATFGCATALDSVCDLSTDHMRFQGPHNPLIRFALADLSTPPLVMWRKSGHSSLFWYSIFACLFIAVRVFYHGIYFVPRMYHGCNQMVKVGVCLYQVLQLFMVVFVLLKWRSMIRKYLKGETETGTDTAGTSDDTIKQDAQQGARAKAEEGAGAETKKKK
jgi:hypothetical protein